MYLTIKQALLSIPRVLNTVAVLVWPVICVISVLTVISGCHCTVEPPQWNQQNITQTTDVECPCDWTYHFRTKL